MFIFLKKWKTTFETTLRVKLAWFVENRIFMIVRGCKLQFSLKIYLCDWNFILYIWYRKYNFFNWLRMMSVLSILTCMKQGMLVSGFFFLGGGGYKLLFPSKIESNSFFLNSQLWFINNEYTFVPGTT